MESTPNPCPDCPGLLKRLAALEDEVRKLSGQVAAARKNSKTSSKPPSSDIVKPKPSPRPDGQKLVIGGQPGHPMHVRELFSAEQITSFHRHELDACPDCGGAIRPNGVDDRVVQQMDVTRPPLTVEQHTRPGFWCDHCQKGCVASLPTGIERGGLVGPNLTTLIAFMKGGCHASYSTIRIFLRDVVGVTIARSTLANTIDKVSRALDGPYDELLKLLPSEPVLNIDETGHHDGGKLWWTWCLRADLYTIYKIDPSRSADVLMNLLGRDFEGIIGCDYFSAYRRYMRVCGVEVQFCLAHLIRDVKYLTTLSDAPTRTYGERLRAALKQLFGVIHRQGEMSSSEFESQLKSARDAVLLAGQTDVPQTRAATNMAGRFRKHGEAFFTFVTSPELEPTNNRAEQAIRFVVIDRHITQGTRSEAGRRWCERIWTVIATCAARKISAVEYLGECVRNYFAGEPSPSLSPTQASA